MREKALFIGLTVVAAAALILLVVLSGQAQPSVSAQILLRNYQFDPLHGEPAVPAGLQAQGTASAWLVQFNGPIEEKWKANLRAAGAQVFSYFPEYAFLVRMDAATAERVRGLPAVRWVGPYHPAYRLQPGLLELEGSIDLYVSTYPDADLAASSAAIEALGGKVRDTAGNELNGYLRVTLPAGAISALAQRDEVLWIERDVPFEIFNDQARGIMTVSNVWSGLNLFGSGQTVAVCDTGLDTGSEATLSNDFKPQFVKAYALGRPGDWSDDNSHGTHVAGSVLGNGTLSGSNPPGHSYVGSFAGNAPEANLVFQSVLDSGGGLGGIPTDLNDLFTPAYNDGARLHSDSWGSSVNGQYTTRSQQVDLFTWTHLDFLTVFAAANQGTDANADGVVDLDSMGSPATAKNTMTVGAMENTRAEITDSWGSWWPSDFPAEPIYSDVMADNANGMAGFSSRGPADDNRIKPDISAPGAWIVSTRSHDPAADTGWGVYNADYLYMGGTSMATPLTTGATTLLREWLIEQRGVPNPSAALIKVLMMNGSRDVAPGQYGTGADQEIPFLWPNNVVGWGRVDLKNSIMPDAPRQIWFDDYTTGLTTGQTRVYTISVGIPLGGAVPPVYAPAAAPAPIAIHGPVSAEKPKAHGFGQGAPIPHGVTQLLGNPGFETGVWSPWTTYGDPQLTVLDWHSGAWSAFMGDGNSQDDEILQTVSIAANATDVTIDFWYGTSTAELYPGVDFFCFGIWPTSGPPAFLEQCVDFSIIGSVPWTHVTYSLSPAELAAVAGQTVVFGYYVWTDFSDPSTAWVDDNGLYVTTPDGATPTPTPPGPTNTPLPGPTNTPLPGGSPLRIGLAWSDYPGDPAAGRALVNDLDLEVIAPNGTHYYGNSGVYTAGSSCLRASLWDQCNNAEVVYVASAATGNWRVIVHGQNIPQGPQPFAITVYGDYVRPGTGPTPTATPTPPGATSTATPTPPGPSATPGGPTNTPLPGVPFDVYLPVISRG